MTPTDEGQLTRLRRETKAMLEPEEAQALCQQIERRFGLGDVAETRITSIYLDHADGRLAGAALDDPTHCLKLRIKEYSPDYGRTGEARCVVELKRQRGPVIRKRRFWVPRACIPAIFRGSAFSILPAPARAARTALLQVGGARVLSPRVTVSYARRVFTLSDTLRVTVDRELAFHDLPDDLLFAARPLGQEALSRPFATERRAIVEVKHISASIPAWLAPLFEGARAAGTFSKFGAAVERLSQSRAPASRRAAEHFAPAGA